ncbi:peptidoglycan-binding domain-containing protein [Paenibacillus sp. Marseille-Q7038]
MVIAKKTRYTALLSSVMLVGSLLIAGNASAEIFTIYPTLSSGSSGGYVESLQANLWSSGLKSTVGDIDGKYGSGTGTAVKSYQSNAGLTADDIAGPATWKSMNKYVVNVGYDQFYYRHSGSTTFETFYRSTPNGDGYDWRYDLRYKSNQYVVKTGIVYSY